MWNLHSICWMTWAIRDVCCSSSLTLATLSSIAISTVAWTKWQTKQSYTDSVFYPIPCQHSTSYEAVSTNQWKHYKDTLKTALNNFQIDPDTWEDAAANSSEWRSRVVAGAAGYEEDRLTRAENNWTREEYARHSLSAAHQHKAISVPTVESHSVLPSDCLVTREHIMAVPISPPTRDLQGECRGHHPIGWTNELNQSIINLEKIGHINLIKVHYSMEWLFRIKSK